MLANYRKGKRIAGTQPLHKMFTFIILTTRSICAIMLSEIDLVVNYLTEVRL